MEQLFPRDLYGRIALALASLFFGPICWVMAFAILFGSRPGGVPFCILAAWALVVG